MNPRNDLSPTEPVALQASHPLDHPIRAALTSHQRGFAQGEPTAMKRGELALRPPFDPHEVAGRSPAAPSALRYRPGVASFATTLEDTPEALAAMHRLFQPDEPMILIQAEDQALPATFALQVDRRLEQMVGVPLPATSPRPDLVPLGPGDAPEMMALVALAQPGPFAARTCELGTYLGIREGGTLIAMAGERMRLEGYTEVSAVCTHPGHRGRGLARTLMTALIQGITARGECPFLHVLLENEGAIRLYRELGFTHRKSMHLKVVTPRA